MKSLYFPDVSSHAELTGLCCGYIIEQVIKKNKTVDYNHIVNSVDDFLADYADQYGLIHYNDTIYNSLAIFLEKKLLLNYKIDIDQIIKNLSQYFENFEKVF